MKKIFSFLGIVLLSMSINAVPATFMKKVAKTCYQPAFIQTLKAQAPKATAATSDSIEIVGLRPLAYYTTAIDFKCRPKKSTYYNFDICTEDGKYISTGGWKLGAFDTLSYNARLGVATLSFQTMYVMNFGINGTNISEYTDNPDVIASFQKQWEKYAVAFDEEDDEVYYCLREGTYSLYVEGLDSDWETTEKYTKQILTVKWYSPENLKVEVSEDNTTASFSWDLPEDLPEGAQVYVAVYNNEGEVAYSNYDSETKTLSPVTSPLTFKVEEGLTYEAAVQIMSADRLELGLMENTIFTVGTSDYAPKNLQAVVMEEEGDSVLFAWNSDAQPSLFGISIYYKSGEYMAKLGYEEGDYITGGQLQAYSAGLRLPTGTYTWKVIAYAYDGQYIMPASEYVDGPEFTTKDITAPVIMGYDVKTTEGSGDVTITFDVEDNYYTVDDMKFYVSGDLSDEWTTTDGAYTINDLEVGKEYTLYFSVEDPEGNINELAFVEVTFTAGVKDDRGISNVVINSKANKVVYDGQLFIKRDNKVFNVLGAQL